MTTDSTSQEPEETPVPVSWVDFLQEQAPGKEVPVTEAVELTGPFPGQFHSLRLPELQLYCPQDTCKGYMFFDTKNKQPQLYAGKRRLEYITYFCRNCQNYAKIFSVAVLMQNEKSVEAYKFGEKPLFGPPVPPRVIRLIQPDRELFLSGRRCENQRLGIGAFSYYRRVVENQWGRLVSEIIRVSEGIKASEETISLLKTAKTEQQFSKSVKNLKDAIPPVLLINGVNPLLLLHRALSRGVHNLTDEECLSLAVSIRVVLVQLAEKLGQALKDEKEITDAVGQLLNIKAKKDSNKKEAGKALEATPDSASSGDPPETP